MGTKERSHDWTQVKAHPTKESRYFWSGVVRIDTWLLSGSLAADQVMAVGRHSSGCALKQESAGCVGASHRSSCLCADPCVGPQIDGDCVSFPFSFQCMNACSPPRPSRVALHASKVDGTRQTCSKGHPVGINAWADHGAQGSASAALCHTWTDSCWACCCCACCSCPSRCCTRADASCSISPSST